MNYEEPVVQEIYHRAWRAGKVEPIGRPQRVSHFLQVVRDTDTSLHSEPWGRVEGGEWDGGMVIRVETKDLPLFFVIAQDALREMKGYLAEEEYNELLDAC